MSSAKNLPDHTQMDCLSKSICCYLIGVTMMVRTSITSWVILVLFQFFKPDLRFQLNKIQSALTCELLRSEEHSGVRRNHYPAAWEFATARGSKHTIFPSEIFSGFRNRGPEPVTPSIWNIDWLCICHPLIELRISRSNRQRSMLESHKDDTV